MSEAGFRLVEPDDHLYATLVRRFDAWNRCQSDWGWETFGLALYDRGSLQAGGRGIVNMGLVEIRGLWVEPELRGRGIGRKLLAAIEAEAMRRGCTRAALDTYSWQAPTFYERAGWRQFGTLEYPNGASRHWFVKELDVPEVDGPEVDGPESDGPESDGDA